MSKHNGDDVSREELEAAQLTAYSLGQLQGEELAAAKAKLASSGETGSREVSGIRSLSEAVVAARNSTEFALRSLNLRKAIEDRLSPPELTLGSTRKSSSQKPARRFRIGVVEWLAIGGLAVVLVALLMPAGGIPFYSMRKMQAAKLEIKSRDNADAMSEALAQSIRTESWNATDPHGYVSGQPEGYQRMLNRNDQLSSGDKRPSSKQVAQALDRVGARADGAPADYFDEVHALHNGGADIALSKRTAEGPPLGVAMEQSRESRDALARQIIESQKKLQAEYRGADENEKEAFIKQASQQQATIKRLWELADAERKTAALDQERLNEALPLAYEVSDPQLRKDRFDYERAKEQARQAKNENDIQGLVGSEQYDPIFENPFLSPLQQPLSTFSIDVDTASYANMRRFLTSGRLPPPNSVRIEELVNYFRYDYPQPKDQAPFSVNMEVTECPWDNTREALTPALSQGERERKGHLLLRVGLKGKDVHRSERPASNLVFLLDVSGSMSDANKLPLLKTAMKLLVGELGENDRVSIVTYAGEAGLKLPPTRGHEQARINRVIDSLSAGGSTNGSAGINLAYEQAAAYFVTGGTNRVILCTDGDLNVGVTSDEALVKLIKQKAAGGVFLTVLGFGEGNLKDAKMEKLADNGNGLYAYIDSVREAKRVLVEQLTGSTITIAKDVKIQIEFNPAQIADYRLLGYENRVLAAQDFNNDKKDAGEIGAGHTVTALYELVPVGAAGEPATERPGTDPLKYQEPGASGQESGAVGIALRGVPLDGKLSDAAKTGELLTLKLRYKEPDGETSKLLEYPLKDRGHSFHSASPDLQFAAAVASFGMILRGSEHRGSSNLAAVAEIASAAIGKDAGGYRAEFVDLVRKAQALGAK